MHDSYLYIDVQIHVLVECTDILSCCRRRLKQRKKKVSYLLCTVCLMIVPLSLKNRQQLLCSYDRSAIDIVVTQRSNCY